jgi:glycosyltransferase involved in cell wall biosynthesis
MRVLAVNQFYPPDISATSQLLGELCEDLVAAGHEVEVIASRGTYRGGERLDRRTVRGGVEVRRPWATSFGKASIAHRMADYTSFWATSLSAALRARRPDVMLSLTTPPMIALGMASVARVRRIPLVTWVQDVYPEIAAQFGVLSPTSPAYLGFRSSAAAAHRLTTRIVALSDGMAERLVAQGASRSALRTIPNWADGRLIRPVPHADNPFRAEHKLGDRFVVMYSGNLGQGHDVETPIAAARILERSTPSVQFLFIGEGARRAEAERLAVGLSNVRFLPYQRKADLAYSLSAADVHLVSLREGLEGLLVPSKLYGALASGRPVCYIGPQNCEVASVVRAHDLGSEGRNGDAQHVAAALAEFARNHDRWRNACVKARRTFEESYDRPVCVARWFDTLGEASSVSS